MNRGEKRQGRRSVQLDRHPSGRSEVRVLDPISLGPDKAIRVDLSLLSAPSNVYDADFAWVEHRVGSAVSIFFGKASRDSKQQLRTRLEVRYPPEGFVSHFWGNTREFELSLRDFAAAWPQDKSRNEIDPSTWPAARDHSEWVGFEAMAHSGTEAMLDFYLLPAVGVARFHKSQGSSGLQVIPIVRVQMTIFELIRLFDLAVPIVDEINQYLPQALQTAREAREKKGERP